MLQKRVHVVMFMLSTNKHVVLQQAWLNGTVHSRLEADINQAVLFVQAFAQTASQPVTLSTW